MSCMSDWLLDMTTNTVSEPAGVAITTTLSTLVIVNIIGNSLVCASIIKNRDMRYVNMWYLFCKFDYNLQRHQRMTLSYKDVAFDLQVSLMRLTLELKIKKQDNKIFILFPGQGRRKSLLRPSYWSFTRFSFPRSTFGARALFSNSGW